MFFHSTTFEGTTFHFSLTSLTSSHFTFTYVLGNNPNPPPSVVHMTQSSSPPGSFSSVNIMLSKLTVNSSSFVATYGNKTIPATPLSPLPPLPSPSSPFPFP